MTAKTETGCPPCPFPPEKSAILRARQETHRDTDGIGVYLHIGNLLHVLGGNHRELRISIHYDIQPSRIGADRDRACSSPDVGLSLHSLADSTKHTRAAPLKTSLRSRARIYVSGATTKEQNEAQTPCTAATGRPVYCLPVVRLPTRT